MGKKQHSKDRMFLTMKEYKKYWGGYKKINNKQVSLLPFYCCCLSLSPFKTPYCTEDGFVFEITEIFPWLEKHKKHPFTGEKISIKNLIKLKFHKNKNGQFYCPVMKTIFNDYSHIVAIKTTGNVFSFQAIKKLNFKYNIMRDLIQDEPFAKTDIIQIQSPEKSQKCPIRYFVGLNSFRKKIKKNKYKISNLVRKVEKKKDIKHKYYSNVHTTSAVSASFTSTIISTKYKQEYKELKDDEIREIQWKKIKNTGKKAYIILITSQGTLNLMLHCDLVPRTCHSFLSHCENNYYKNTIFHRKITSFIIQGGDPTGTGYGGESAWGANLDDEISKCLKHNERGIVSMANNGPNSAGSQL